MVDLRESVETMMNPRDPVRMIWKAEYWRHERASEPA